MNRKHLIILSAILVLLFSCTDPIELPTSGAMATPASVLRNIVEEHDYQAKSRNVSGDPEDFIPVTDDNFFRTILAYDLSRLSDLKFNEFRSIELEEYDHSDSTASYFKDNIPPLGEMDLNYIKQAIKELIQFKAIQVNKIDDKHADIYFEVIWDDRESLCMLKCELNEFGIFDTESLSWCEQNGPDQNQKGYSYSKTLWLPDHAESYYLGTLEDREVSSTRAIINAKGTKYWKLHENSEDATAFLHPGETQKNMLKAIFAWKDSISK